MSFAVPQLHWENFSHAVKIHPQVTSPLQTSRQ